MLSKKDLLKKCEDLQRQIYGLQEQINTLRSEYYTVPVTVIDEKGKPVMVSMNQSYTHLLDYPKTTAVTLKESIEAILRHLDMELKMVDVIPSKTMVTRRSKNK